jgi:hypothetical protein
MKTVMLTGSLVVVAAVSGIVVAQRLHAAVGDCTGLHVETNADCDYQGNCAGATQGTCRPATYSCPGGVCNPDPCQAELPTDIRKRGTCYNGWWDDGCIHCNTYVCGSWVEYQSIDSNGACQTSRCSGTYTCSNCCIPDAEGT